MNKDELRAEIGWSLVLVARLYRREVDRELQLLGLSQAVTTPLRYLARNKEPLRQGALAAELHIEGPTLISVIEQMEAQGWIHRVEDASDRRAKLLQITSAGADLNTSIERRLTSVRAKLFSEIDVEHLKAFDDALNKMSHNLRELKSLKKNA